MKDRASLRLKLLLGVSICMVLTALIGGALTYTLFRRHLYQQLDHSLTDKLRFLRAACSQVGDEVLFDASEELWQRLHDPDDPEFFSLHLPDGTAILRSESLDEGGLPKVGGDSFEPVFELITLPNGRPGHCAGQLFHPAASDRAGEPIAVHAVVAHDSGRIVLALGRLRELLVTVGTATTILLLSATFVIVRRHLRPLQSLARQIEEISVIDPEARFHLEEAPAELGPVVRRLNALMDRVASAIETERQFTASAAHELRNPLAAIRSQIEVALGRSRSAGELREVLREVAGIEQRLERMVENLLMLARLQAGEVRVVGEPVDLRDVLRRTWKGLFEAAEAKELRVLWQGGEDLEPLCTSETLLQIVIGNLLDNAVSYVPHGGTIRVVLEATGGKARIRIGNDNPGLEEADLANLFQRFWRHSVARDGEHVHAGLGLDLCRRIAEVLGVRLDAHLSEGLVWLELEFPEPGGREEAG